MLFDVLSQHARKVLGIIKQTTNSIKSIFHHIEGLLEVLSSYSLDTTNTSSYTTFGKNLEETYATSALCMDTTTELYAVTKLYDTYFIPIFLAKEGDSSHLLGFLDRCFTMFLQREIRTNLSIY